MALDDADVVRRVVAGDANEFRVLVERHQDAIYRFVRALVGHRHEAEDVTQEAFLAAYRNLGSFDCHRAKFSTWLFTIARNRAINHRKRKCAAAVELITEPTAVAPATDVVEEREFIERLNQSLNALPVDQRTVFALAEIEQLSYAEIADIEQISLGTVKSRLHRAKRRLSAALETYARG